MASRAFAIGSSESRADRQAKDRVSDESRCDRGEECAMAEFLKGSVVGWHAKPRVGWPSWFARQQCGMLGGGLPMPLLRIETELVDLLVRTERKHTTTLRRPIPY